MIHMKLEIHEGPMQVEMVVVGDDCALPHSRITGRRGIAGTVFVHKVPHLSLGNIVNAVTRLGPMPCPSW